MAQQAALCPSCGNPRSECMADGRDQAYDAKALVCHATAAKDRAERAMREQTHGELIPGLRWHVFER